MPTILVNVLLVMIGDYFSSKLAERVKMPPMLGMMVFSILGFTTVSSQAAISDLAPLPCNQLSNTGDLDSPN